MNRVLRSVPISDESVTISVRSEAEEDEALEVAENAEEQEAFEGDQMIGLEEVADRIAEEESEPEEPPPSAMDIEKRVEARLEEFEARFQQEKEDAYHAGFEDGTNEGTKQGLAQSADEIERFSALVESLPVQWKDAVKNYDAAILDLAVRLAQRIVGAAAEASEEVIL